MIITIDTEDPQQIEDLTEGIDRAYHRRSPEAYAEAPASEDGEDTAIVRDALLDFHHKYAHEDVRAVCNHHCEVTPSSTHPDAAHYLDCPVWLDRLPHRLAT